MITEADDSKIRPHIGRVDIGKTLDIVCNSNGNTKWFHTYLSSLPVLYDDNKYLIKSAHQNQEGNYYCYGKYKNTKRHFLAKTLIKVYGKQFH